MEITPPITPMYRHTYGKRAREYQRGRPKRLKYGKRAPWNRHGGKKTTWGTGTKVSTSSSIIEREVIVDPFAIQVAPSMGNPAGYGAADRLSRWIGVFSPSLNDNEAFWRAMQAAYQLCKCKRAELFVKLIPNSCQDNLNDDQVFVRIVPWKNKFLTYNHFLSGTPATHNWDPSKLDAVKGATYKIINGADPEVSCALYYPVLNINVALQDLPGTSGGIYGGLKCMWSTTEVDSPSTTAVMPQYNGFYLAMNQVITPTASSGTCTYSVAVYLKETWLFKNIRGFDNSLITPSQTISLKAIEDLKIKDEDEDED